MKTITAIILTLLSFSVVDLSVPYIPSKKTLECMATNVYREARGEPAEGQVAVAKVVLNRMKMKEYPDTECEVIYQKNQFSWTNKYKSVVYDYPSVNNAVKAYADTSNDATHYHAVSVRPTWAKRLKEGITIGNHKFYYP